MRPPLKIIPRREAGEETQYLRRQGLGCEQELKRTRGKRVQDRMVDCQGQAEREKGLSFSALSVDLAECRLATASAGDLTYGKECLRSVIQRVSVCKGLMLK